MSFYASSDNIRITNSSGVEMFNTDWKMPAITSTLSGVIVMPSRGVGVTTTTVVNHDLGAAPYSPSFVLAVAKITNYSGYPWADTMFNSSGSVISNLAWVDTGSLNWKIRGARTITFYVSAGRLYLREEYYNGLASLSLSSYDLTYKVYLGSYV
jgi:hypothetical protein